MRIEQRPRHANRSAHLRLQAGIDQGGIAATRHKAGQEATVAIDLAGDHKCFASVSDGCGQIGHGRRAGRPALTSTETCARAHDGRASSPRIASGVADKTTASRNPRRSACRSKRSRDEIPQISSKAAGASATITNRSLPASTAREGSEAERRCQTLCDGALPRVHTISHSFPVMHHEICVTQLRLRGPSTPPALGMTKGRSADATR